MKTKEKTAIIKDINNIVKYPTACHLFFSGFIKDTYNSLSSQYRVQHALTMHFLQGSLDMTNLMYIVAHSKRSSFKFFEKLVTFDNIGQEVTQFPENQSFLLGSPETL